MINSAADSSTKAPFVQRIAEAFREFEYVKAVAVAGSRGTGNSDRESDYDLYLYSEREIPVAFRRTLLGVARRAVRRWWTLNSSWRRRANSIWWQ